MLNIDWTLCNLRLQKILYLAHAVHLSRHGGEPLMLGSFEASNLGPVHPVLFREVRVFGADPVGDVFGGVPDVEDERKAKTLDEALASLQSLSAARLVSMTHRKEGAWHENFDPKNRFALIPNSDILREFSGAAPEVSLLT